MAIIPKQESFFWLFDDTAGTGMFKFDDFNPKYKTRNDKELPVFVLSGKNKQDVVGDFLIAIWNISNLNELQKTLGEDSELWKGKFFVFEPSEVKGKLLMKQV